MIKSKQVLFNELSTPFDVSEVKQRKGGGGKTLDFVGWDSVARRLNEVMGPNWSTKGSVNLDINGQAFALIHLTIYWPDGEETTRMGSGADKDGRDPDKAIKTAQAEALKKAANQFGIALELWDKDWRDELAEQRKTNQDKTYTINQLKTDVYQGICEILGVSSLTTDKIIEWAKENYDKEFNAESLQHLGDLKELLTTIDHYE